MTTDGARFYIPLDTKRGHFGDVTTRPIYLLTNKAQVQIEKNKGKYCIEYSLASASDGPCPRRWWADAEIYGSTLKMEFPHARFSILTTALRYPIRGRSLPADVLATVLRLQPGDKRAEVLDHRSSVELALSRHQAHCVTPRPTRSQPQHRPIQTHVHRTPYNNYNNNNNNTTTTTILLLLLLHLFNGLFSMTTWVSRYQNGKTSLDLNMARDDWVLGCSGISWTTCKQPAPRSRQITTPTPHQSLFTGRMLFPTPNQQCQSTVGKSDN